MGLFNKKEQLAQQPQPEYLPEQDYMPQGVPMPARSDRADMIDKLNPDKEMVKFRLSLMGCEEVDGMIVKIPELQKRALTPIGAWEISDQVRSMVNNIMQNSRISADEKKGRLIGITDTINKMMLGNWQRYGINNATTISSVKDKVYNFSLAILSQATNGSMQELWKNTVVENRLTTDRNERQGMIKGLLGLGRN